MGDGDKKPNGGAVVELSQADLMDLERQLSRALASVRRLLGRDDGRKAERWNPPELNAKR